MKSALVRCIGPLFALVCMSALPAALRADTFTYTYTSGTTPDTGTATAFSLSYTGTGLLADNDSLVDTDSCTVTAFSVAHTCTSLALGPHGTTQYKFAIFNGGNQFTVYLPTALFASTGTQTDAGGNTLTITDVATTSDVPEPGSIALLGTGLLGLAGVVRRRVMC